MNKAFVKESDGDDDDELALPALPVGSKNYMTPQGHQRIKDELLHLIDVARPEVVRIVSWAASNGDRSENGDHIYFGATVTYENQHGVEQTVTIVGIDELDPLNGKISWISPVARTLTKAREGDEVTLQTPAGIDHLTVIAVSYPVPPD